MSLTPSVFLRASLFSTLALIAMAANSVLGRLALGGETIDAAGYTLIRLVSGALTLALIVLAKSESPWKGEPKHWLGAIMLFAYAVTFSYAYLSLDTGTGALILFGAVQISMVLYAFVTGSRLPWLEWLGLLVAFAGFIYLVLPGVSAPSLSGFLLMTLSGIAWAGYTLIGRGSKQAILDTGRIFVRVFPMVAVLLLLTWPQLELTSRGVLIAALSGSVTSAMGYILWYQALAYLSAVQAGVLQLLVPLLATMGGVVFLSEVFTLRLLLSSLMILGGILLVMVGRQLVSKRI